MNTDNLPVELDGRIYVYTDGSSLGNPGPGGYGAVIRFNGTQLESGKGFANTTNNIMELLGVIETLEAISTNAGLRRMDIEVVSDSEYVTNPMIKGWLQSWAKNHWRKKDGKPVANLFLWKRMYELIKLVSVTFTPVRGHVGHIYNERCDVIAKTYATAAKAEGRDIDGQLDA